MNICKVSVSVSNRTECESSPTYGPFNELNLLTFGLSVVSVRAALEIHSAVMNSEEILFDELLDTSVDGSVFLEDFIEDPNGSNVLEQAMKENMVTEIKDVRLNLRNSQRSTRFL